MKYLVVFILLFAVSAGLAAAQVGQKAPDLTVKSWLTDNPPQVKTLAGRVTVIEFWATWCSPCVKNIPHLNEIHRKYSDKGVELIALSQDKKVSKVSKFIKQHKMEYNVAVDNGSAEWYGIEAYPTIVITNAWGVVTWKGYPWDKNLEREIAKALATSPEPVVGGVHLGPFSDMKSSLKGGKTFKKAYNEIERCSNDHLSPKRTFAARILESINRRLHGKLSFAKSIEKDDPKTAIKLYSDLADNYSGAEIQHLAAFEIERLKKK